MNSNNNQSRARTQRSVSIFLLGLLAGHGDATQPSTTAFTVPRCVDIENIGGQKQAHSCRLPCSHLGNNQQSCRRFRHPSSLSMSLPDESSLQSSRRPKKSSHNSFLKSTREAVMSNIFTEDLIEQRQQQNTIGMENSIDLSGVWQVISAALLITGNTVGASIVVLPNAAAGPGLALSSALWVGVYFVNLFSGLLIAEVAINQRETSGDDVPSSFKDFVDSNLDTPILGNCVGITSVFVNSCVLAFSLIRAGDMLGAHLPGIDSTQGAIGFSAALAAVLGTQSNVSLSRITSGAVTCLFATFAAILLPGLANVQDPMGVYLAPGTTEGVVDSMMTVAPIFIQCAIWQNIAPSVTKLLDYDRTKTVMAMSVGSAIPIIMDFAWSLAVQGGGIDMSVASGGPVLLSFMAVSLVGSSVACGMSIAGELDSLLPSKLSTKNDGSASKETIFPLASVLLAVAPSLAAGIFFSGGEDFTAALSYAGAYGSPLLYGLLPVALSLTQLNADKQKLEATTGISPERADKVSVPGGVASLSALAAASVGCIAQQLSSDLGGVLSSFQPM